MSNNNNILRVGTDCSGIEAPIQALLQLNIPFIHKFSSDIDKYVIKSIKANYHPEIIFGDPDGPFPIGDITKRDIKDVPDIDLYVAGFPCQPFSSAGKRKGFNDSRGNVFWSCLEVIKMKKPKYFILENVRGLLSHDKEHKKDKYGRTWKTIWGEMEQLESLGYSVKWKLLNTRDYGIPQNRNRIFIVGIKGSDFKWPEEVEMDDIKNYVDWTDNKCSSIPPRIMKSKYLEKIKVNSMFVDFSFYGYSTFPNSDKFCSCISAKSELWCVPQKRLINTKELLRLQGFDQTFIQVVSYNRIKSQVGNSMSVNILKCLMKQLKFFDY
jgi:DNA (cytosine-5)-methyltransferase 1